jgi:D-alanine-D-alanine ligase
MENILVVFGGNSVEAEVSVVTANLVLNCLNSSKYNAIPVFITKDNRFCLGDELKSLEFFKNGNQSTNKTALFCPGSKNLYYQQKGKIKKLCVIDGVLNCCHGGLGEGGSLIGFFKSVGIEVYSPTEFCSSLLLDKFHTKTFFKCSGVKTVGAVLHEALAPIDKTVALAEKRLSYPMIVKPATLGSSIGIGVAKNKTALINLITSAIKYDDRVVVEEFLSGAIELNCAVYRGENGIKISECERPLSKGDILSFDDKYFCGERVFPADIPTFLADEIKSITQKVYTMLDISGVIRIDYLYHNGKVYLNEVNTVPGSLALYLFADDPKGYFAVLDDIIRGAKRKNNLKYSLKNIDQSYIFGKTGSKGAKLIKSNNV